jgi:hypothetical protein
MVLQNVSTPSAMKEWPYKWYGLSWGGQFSIIFLSQSILNLAFSGSGLISGMASPEGGQFSIIFLSQSILNLAFSGSGLISGMASPEGDNLVLFFWPLVVVTL